MHNSPLRPGAHGQEFENRIWYVMEIEKNHLEIEWSGSRALYVQNTLTNLHAVIYRLKVQKRGGATSFIGLMTGKVVTQIQRGLNAFEYK